MPLMFTALGETISERAGVLNIGLEGMMLLGAYAGFLGAYYGHTQWLGFLAGGLAGMAASLLMVVLCVWLGLDQIVVGIAITLAGEGITSVLQEAEFGGSYPRLGAAPTVSIPLLDRIPVARLDPLRPAADRLPRRSSASALLTWIFRSTNIGLNLRAAGEKPEALDAAGVSVDRDPQLGGARDRRPRRARRRLPLDRRRRALHAVHHAGPGLHGDRDRDARPRARRWWVLFGSLLFGISLSLVGLAADRRHHISTDLVNMLPVRRDHRRADPLRAPLRTCRPSLALPYVRGAR